MLKPQPDGMVRQTSTCTLGEWSLLVFADDWGRHPSSCQHLVRHLLGRHRVTWVNTIGTRRPQLDLATVRRGWEKLRQWIRQADQPALELPEGLRVVNPRMWPAFGSKFERRMNQTLLCGQLAPLLRAASAPTVALTTIPIVADLMGKLPVHKWVYYCVDDFGAWPGLDRRTLQRMERTVIAQADLVIAVSDTLCQKLSDAGRQAHLLTHGVDIEFWRPKPDGESSSRRGQSLKHPSLEAFDKLQEPIVVFWGVIDRRLDLALVKRLADDLERGTVVFVGPQAEPDPVLSGLPRVAVLPALPLETLPTLAQRAAVLIMPYADLPVTRAMQPLKLKEYLATGKPAVVRDLPSTRPWSDAADLAVTPEEFSRLVRLRIDTGLLPEQRQARSRLAGESWEAKAQQLEQWITSGESRPHDHSSA